MMMSPLRALAARRADDVLCAYRGGGTSVTAGESLPRHNERFSFRGAVGLGSTRVENPLRGRSGSISSRRCRGCGVRGSSCAPAPSSLHRSRLARVPRAECLRGGSSKSDDRPSSFASTPMRQRGAVFNTELPAASTCPTLRRAEACAVAQ